MGLRADIKARLRVAQKNPPRGEGAGIKPKTVLYLIKYLSGQEY